MTKVEADQHWGVPAGAPAGVTVHLKTGDLPRATAAGGSTASEPSRAEVPTT